MTTAISVPTPVPLTAVDRLKVTLMSGAFGPKSLGLPEMVKALLWQSRLSPHFVVHYHDDTGADDGLLDDLADAFESIYADLMTCMQIVPASKPERITLETRLICYVIRTSSPRTFGSVESPGVLFYLMDPQQDSEYLGKFRHEIAHLIWGRSYGEAPPLFNEGVAVYAEVASEPVDRAGCPPATATAITSLPSVAKLAPTDLFWEEYRSGRPVYKVSGFWIRYLVERWGWGRLGALFLASDYDDPEIVSRFQTIYGHSLETVEADWHRWLSGDGCSGRMDDAD